MRDIGPYRGADGVKFLIDQNRSPRLAGLPTSSQVRLSSSVTTGFACVSCHSCTTTETPAAGSGGIGLGSVWVANAADYLDLTSLGARAGTAKPESAGFHGFVGHSPDGTARFLNRVSQVRSLPGAPREPSPSDGDRHIEGFRGGSARWLDRTCNQHSSTAIARSGLVLRFAVRFSPRGTSDNEGSRARHHR